MYQEHLLITFHRIDIFLSSFHYDREGELISDLKYTQIFLLNEMLEMREREENALSLTALSRRTGFAKASLSSALKILRKAGYVDMVMDNKDNRRKTIFLTQKTEDAVPEIKQYLYDVSRLLCEGIGVKELETLEQSLDKISENIEGIRARNPC